MPDPGLSEAGRSGQGAGATGAEDATHTELTSTGQSTCAEHKRRHYMLACVVIFSTIRHQQQA